MRKFFQALLGPKATTKRLQVLPQGITLDVAPGQSLLEAALAQGVPYPHNCTVGTCASCKSRLVQGNVREATPFGYTLSKQELDAGYILACQAFPRDELTIVEIPAPGAELPPIEHFEGRVTTTAVLTHDILRVTVRTDRPVHYVAGQYASMRFEGLPRNRHYSFAEAPQREGRKDLTFFIRRVPGGVFTEALFAGKLDDQALSIDAPQGAFHLREGNAPMVCVVGGSGLAPLLSVLEDARKHRIRRRCVLLFGARTQADLYMLEAIRHIAASWLEPFDFVPVLSHEPEGSDWAGARGLVTEFIAGATSGFALAGAEAYMCGPPPMIDAAIAAMVGAGLPLDSIHYDKFIDGQD